VKGVREGRVAGVAGVGVLAALMAFGLFVVAPLTVRPDCAGAEREDAAVASGTAASLEAAEADWLLAMGTAVLLACGLSLIGAGHQLAQRQGA
jgi:hypothetical protein